MTDEDVVLLYEDMAHLRAEVARLRAQNAAMREIVQAVAFSEQIHPYGPIECLFRCAHSFADETGQFTLDHSPDCPVTKARAILTAEQRRVDASGEPPAE